MKPPGSGLRFLAAVQENTSREGPDNAVFGLAPAINEMLFNVEGHPSECLGFFVEAVILSLSQQAEDVLNVMGLILKNRSFTQGEG
eukprot:7101765-Pyramimonas_sp.AAC.1